MLARQFYSSKLLTQPALVTFVFIVLILAISSVLYVEVVLSTAVPSSRGLEVEFSAYRYAPAWITKYFPPPSAKEREDYHQWNDQTFLELHACIAGNNCGVNQLKVAVLGSHYFEERIVRGQGGGEGIWGQSMYNTMRNLGYTTFFANNWNEALKLYQKMPDLIKVVILLRPAECQNNPTCVKGPENPTGIPAWKIFDLSYWPLDHPEASRLGGKWIITSHPDISREERGEESPYQYIGFSIEEQCRQHPVIPLSQRKGQIWLFMKIIRYVYDPWFSWERPWFSELAQETDLKVVGGWKVVQDDPTMGVMQDIEDRKHGVINLGPQDHPGFIQEVSNSKAMLAVGNPSWSPTPWEALCYGVPFIHPIRNFDRNDPWNRQKWDVQHPVLKMLHEPYVYHAHKGNYTELIEAVRKATTTPIDSFIPDFMTETAFRKRIKDFMETDWRSLAEEWLEERKSANDYSYIFEL
ncbi:hypothetical protein BDQ17DRAFT_1351185 [Cyathus striatus]|nr:hypothetical protein BDQ17DRAFT_1351185 [Cyathus striatus]